MLLLDLYAGVGGAAAGYHKAVFAIQGVDKYWQPNYPFPLKVCDALENLEALVELFKPDVIHASPPCQSYSKVLMHMASPKSQHIEQLRIKLQETGLPYVIENPPSWGVLHKPLVLCGTMFGLRVQRHREFESNVPMQPPCPCNHVELAINPYNREGRKRVYEEFGRLRSAERVWGDLMGVPWATALEARQCVPPAMTEYIGRQLTRCTC